jgi:hypothetical protein
MKLFIFSIFSAAEVGLCIFFFLRKMSSGSSQRRATRARTENRQVILERNILRADTMVAPLDFIAKMI